MRTNFRILEINFQHGSTENTELDLSKSLFRALRASLLKSHTGSGSIRLAADGRRFHGPMRLALRTRTIVAQILPGKDAVLVAIVPGEANSILADRLDLSGPRRRLEHRQRSRDRLDGIARVTAILLALFVAQGARTGVTQKRKAIDALVAVLPLDLHTGTGGDVYFDGFWIG